MGNFSNNVITDVGKMLLADVQAGAVFTPTRIVVGSGTMIGGATTQSMTAVITPVKSIAINKKQRTPDGKCIFGGVYTNEEVTAPFYFRELALYAKAVYLNADGTVKSEGAETLYSYGNAGTTADYMPAYSTSTVVEKQIDLITWVGNDAQVDLTIETGVYVTREQAVLNMQYINPDTVGFDSLLEYMVSIYDKNMIVCGHISGFSDMPEDVTLMHGYINVVGGMLTVSANTRTAYYYRGTNSLTEWTSEWRRAYDPTEDLTIDKAIAAVKLQTPNGTGSIFKNANVTNDLGTTISDSTADGATDRINLSAARPLAEKLRLTVDGKDIYNVLHTGNKSLIKPADIGAAPGGYGVGGPYYHIPPNSAITIKFDNERNVALIAVQGSMYTTRAVLAVNSFGIGGDTTYVERVSGREGILYGITPQSSGNGVVIFNDTADAAVLASILVLQGVYPTVTTGDSGITPTSASYVSPATVE